MAEVKWGPLQDLQTMQDHMNKLFEMGRARAFSEPFAQGLWQPPVDIYEDEREIVVKMEVPEVPQEQIQVQIEDSVLIIQGERKLEREERQQNYHRIERSYGPFRRTFALPAAVDQQRVAASCEQGVLKVVLPKKQPESVRQIEIAVR